MRLTPLFKLLPMVLVLSRMVGCASAPHIEAPAHAPTRVGTLCLDTIEVAPPILVTASKRGGIAGATVDSISLWGDAAKGYGRLRHGNHPWGAPRQISHCDWQWVCRELSTAVVTPPDTPLSAPGWDVFFYYTVRFRTPLNNRIVTVFNAAFTDPVPARFRGLVAAFAAIERGLQR